MTGDGSDAGVARLRSSSGATDRRCLDSSDSTELRPPLGPFVDLFTSRLPSSYDVVARIARAVVKCLLARYDRAHGASSGV
jgi:hypothetical protein